MRIDGTTCEATYIDPDSGGIVLRRLHPRVANYNDLVLFLMQCNMEIKLVGSGEAAKALLYYVTDYITKLSLPTHIGLSALSYAIQKTNERFPDLVGRLAAPDIPERARGALTITVNRMMSRQEMSHQQVMSYLIGGGDVYRSHTFRVLHWGSFDRLFEHDANPTEPRDINDIEEENEDIFTLSLGSGSISAGNQQQDYIYRSTDAPFDKLCLYEFVGTVEKITKRSDNKRAGVHSSAVDAVDASKDDAPFSETMLSQTNAHRRGRKAEPRGIFSSDQHTQYRTHCLRRRAEWTVPVILGDRVPRSDRGEEEHESWARMMLILFIPWRKPRDLRERTESWSAAFDRQKPLISSQNLRVIANMNVLSECRDVRDSFRDMRRAEALSFLQNGLPAQDGAEHTGVDDDVSNQDYQLFDTPAMYDAYDNVQELVSSQAGLDAKIGSRSRELLDECYGSQVDVRMAASGGISIRHSDDEAALMQHSATMKLLKKQRRPRFADDEDQDTETRPQKRRRRVGVSENISRSTLGDVRTPQGDCVIAPTQDPISAAVDQIVEEMHLHDNAEQERAFRIVAEHVNHGGEQLLMYIAGVGGTGKTYVIKAVLRLFELLGR
ncbi:hypothetical protein C2E23DRAFT_697913, partial [Lenzites betulinus]